MTDKLLTLGLFVAAAALITLGFATSTYLKDRSLVGWPTVMAHIESSEIVRVDLGSLDMPARAQFGLSQQKHTTERVWTLAISYRYKIGDKQYDGDRATSSPLRVPAWSESFMPSAELESIFDRLQPGKDHPIHVNPADPRESYIEYLPDPGLPPLLLGGLGLLIASSFIFGIWLNMQGKS